MAIDRQINPFFVGLKTSKVGVISLRQIGLDLNCVIDPGYTECCCFMSQFLELFLSYLGELKRNIGQYRHHS